MKLIFIAPLMIFLLACGSSPKAPPTGSRKLSSDAKPATPSAKGTSGVTSQARAEAQGDKNLGLGDDLLKARIVLEHIVKWDEKKAKVAFSRSYRKMPPSFQFAYDLRFRNIDHALSVLPHVEKSEEEKAFWHAILKKKGRALGDLICQEFLKSGAEFENLKPLDSYLKQQASVMAGLQIEPLNQKPSKLDEELTDVTVPLTPEMQGRFMTDKYYDNLHNMQRRDIRMVREIFRDTEKLKSYRRYIQPENLFALNTAVAATESPLQGKFLRRFKGFARDYRNESIPLREQASALLEDRVDQEAIEQLKKLKNLDGFLWVVARFDHELATCGLAKSVDKND